MRLSLTIYSILTGDWQYDSIITNKKVIQEDGGLNSNGFRPPIEEPAINRYKAEEKWENAKRLAAILYIAIEDYGETNESTNQKDSGDRVNFRSYKVNKNNEDPNDKYVDPVIVGGNIFFNEEK